MSEGLAQGPYVVARVGFEPAMLGMQGTNPTIEPPRPMHVSTEGSASSSEQLKRIDDALRCKSWLDTI